MADTAPIIGGPPPGYEEAPSLHLVQGEGLREPTLEEYVERTIEHMGRPEVFARYAQIKTQREWQAWVQTSDHLYAEAKKDTRSTILTTAALALKMTVEQARLLRGGEWHDQIQITANKVSELSGRTFKEDLFALHLTEEENSEMYRSRWDLAKAEFTLSYNLAIDKWAKLLGDLWERRKDPIFLEAAGMWENSWDSQRYTGPDGYGFHAGLIHGIEYATSKDKRKRIDVIGEIGTADEWIAYTNRLYEVLVTCEDETGPSNSYAAVLQDRDTGDKKYFILTPFSPLVEEGEFIVGYQRHGEKIPKLTSMITPVSLKYFGSAIRNCMDGQDAERGYLNIIGPNVDLVTLKAPQSE